VLAHIDGYWPTGQIVVLGRYLTTTLIQKSLVISSSYYPIGVTEISGLAWSLRSPRALTGSEDPPSATGLSRRRRRKRSGDGGKH